MRRNNIVSIVLISALVLLAPAASAVYVVTPLRAHASTNAADVGDTIDVTIEPENETTAAEWAGKLVHAYYAYDPNEGAEDPDAQTSSEAYARELIDDSIALVGKAAGSFAWTVPAAVDDHNVVIRIESPDGELLAIADVAVGDAPPIMRTLAGSDAELADDSGPAETSGGAPDAVEEHGTTQDVPAPGLLALAAIVGLAAITWRRRA